MTGGELFVLGMIVGIGVGSCIGFVIAVVIGK